MEQKLTPWFPAEVNPVRVGVYEIKGCRFGDQRYRKWLGVGWSGTHLSPLAASRSPILFYGPGEDMTGWRGLAEAQK